MPMNLQWPRTYWDIGELGDMHHNPAKNVLHVKRPIEPVAKELQTRARRSGGPAGECAGEACDDARRRGPTPYIDRTIYTGWNAMAMSAYIQAVRSSGGGHSRVRLQDTGSHSDRGMVGRGWLAHVVAYAAGEGGPRIPGMLDDYAMPVHACIDAWEQEAGDALLPRSGDAGCEDAADFYDAPVAGSSTPRQIRRRSARSPRDASRCRTRPRRRAIRRRPRRCCAWRLNGDAKLRDVAEDTLESFAGIVEHFGLYAGSYGLALERLLSRQSRWSSLAKTIWQTSLRRCAIGIRGQQNGDA